MLYLKDENVTNYLTGDCYYVDSIDFIMCTLDALLDKKYYNAKFILNYRKGEIREVATVALGNGKTNISEILDDYIYLRLLDIREFYIELDFKYKYSASHIKLWCNNRKGRIYMNEQAKKTLYTKNCLLDSNHELEELMSDINFIKINIPLSLPYTSTLYYDFIKLFKQNKKNIMKYSGEFDNPKNEKLYKILMYLNPANRKKYITLGDNVFKEPCILTGEDIMTNISNANFLLLNNIYCFNTDILVRLNWNCRQAEVLRLSLDNTIPNL